MDGGIRIARDEIFAAMSQLIQVMSLIGALSLLTSSVVIFFVSRAHLRPVTEVGRMLKEISEGASDLTREIDIRSRDEAGVLAQSFNTFSDRLRQIVTKIKDATHQSLSVKDELVHKTRPAPWRKTSICRKGRLIA